MRWEHSSYSYSCWENTFIWEITFSAASPGMHQIRTPEWTMNRNAIVIHEPHLCGWAHLGGLPQIKQNDNFLPPLTLSLCISLSILLSLPNPSTGQLRRDSVFLPLHFHFCHSVCTDQYGVKSDICVWLRGRPGATGTGKWVFRRRATPLRQFNGFSISHLKD